MPHNVESHTGEGNDFEGNLSIFTLPSRPFRRHTTRMLSEQEINVAHQYVLLNCIEVKPYMSKHLNSTIALMIQLFNSTNKCSINRIFITKLRKNEPYINDATVDARLDEFFPAWFNTYVRSLLF